MKKNSLIFPLALLFCLIAIFYQSKVILAEESAENILTNAKSLYYNNIHNSFEQFDQIVTAQPENDEARMNLIRILREMGQYKAAISHLKVLLQQKPQEGRYRLALIEITYLAGNPVEVLQLANTDDLSADELYWKGLALADLGIETEAIQALSNSVAIEPFHPLAYFFLGEIYLKIGDYEKAVADFKTAANQDPELTQVYFPLAKAYIALGKYLTAYNYLSDAIDEKPWDHEISDALKKLATTHPEIFKQQEDEDQKTARVTLPLQVTPILGDREKIPVIRIGLAEKIQHLYLRAGGLFHLSDSTGKIRFTGKAQSVLLIKQKNYRLEVYNKWGSRLFRSNGSILLNYEDPANTTVLFEVRYRSGSFWAGREDRIYRGSFQFLPRVNGLTIVNRLNLEEYLYGVIPSEMEYIWPADALEAQAIAARTYALSNKNSYNSRGFDLLPTIASQVYDGVLAERASTNYAVDATRGLILTFNGKPISAFYTGNSGGYTVSSQDIWGDSIPYLQTVPDKLLPAVTKPMGPEELAQWLISRPPTYSSNPKYSAPSHYRWTAWISCKEIEHRLKLGAKLGQITSIVIAKRTNFGVVTEVIIQGENGEYTLTGDSIRSKLGGLRSNMFILEPKLDSSGLPESYIFNGGGWGHGVGLCQSGAAGMAADGYKFNDILSHYYPGAELAQLY